MPLYGKDSGEWEDIVELYANQDGVWVILYDSYALIQFSNYGYPIPVMAGWQYSTDKVTWTVVDKNGTINTSGTFTGYVRAKSQLVLKDYYDFMEPGLKATGTSLSAARSHLTSFSFDSRAFVCGGYNGGSYYSRVEYYDKNGTLTSGNNMSEGRMDLTSFALEARATAYVCGGQSSSGYSAVTDKYDWAGNRTTGTPLSLARSRATSFRLNNMMGFVCGGRGGTSTYATRVDVYDDAGNRTTGTALSTNTSYASSVGGNSGFVFGGETNSSYSSNVDRYSGDGTRTSATPLSLARSCTTSFTLGDKIYVCGGLIGSTSVATRVDVYDTQGNLSTGTPLPDRVYHATSFVLDKQYGYVCGGRKYNTVNNYFYTSSVVYVYDTAGNVTTGSPLNTGTHNATSFVLDNKGYVCGGVNDIDWEHLDDHDTTTYNSDTTVFYNKYIAHIPITAKSTYTLAGITGTPTVSEVLNFEAKTSGTVDYKRGSIVGANGTI